MSDETVRNFFSTFFGVSIILGIYVVAQTKKHVSQPRLRSFLILFIPLCGTISIWILVVASLNAIFTLPRNQAVTSFFVGGIVVTVVWVSRWAVNHISKPLPGWVYQPNPSTEDVTIDNGIRRAEYIVKYRVSEAKLSSAISSKKIDAELIDGELFVRDCKF